MLDVRVRTSVVRINRVIHVNPPSVYMRKYGKFQPFKFQGLTRVGNIFHVNGYRRLTEEGLPIAVIQPGLETSPGSCKEALIAKALVMTKNQ